MTNDTLSSLTSHLTSQSLTSDAVTPLDLSHVTPEVISPLHQEDTTPKDFYKDYDASNGIHTAALLGGCLVWVVIYVFYRWGRIIWYKDWAQIWSDWTKWE